ncbi:MAG: hypothetical protein ACF8CQ_00860, partial [Rhodopirellula sp. JB044]|uniref:hypothetical protein n=1 Tax=Rhodopirellula sp. JB044 TaxID=3342844 RepID=UPI00370A7556
MRFPHSPLPNAQARRQRESTRCRRRGLSWSSESEPAAGISQDHPGTSDRFVPFGIALQVIPGQSEIPNLLLTELEAGRAQSAYDLLWINGENYHQLRQMDALYGPFVEYLPNNRYIDWSNPIIAYDFQQPVDGFEA